MTLLLTTRRGRDTADGELVSRAQAGDVAAFEALTEVHADRLYAVVLRLVGDAGEAEDVVQETLLRAWRGLRRFRARSTYFTWLYRIAVNEANRALEKRSRAGVVVPVDDDEGVQLPAPAHDGPASRAEEQELRHAIDLAIARLAPPHRTALVLRDIEGLSTREAAEMVGIGQAAFKSRLHQARLNLRAALGDAALVEAGP
jgi:RNA polymerase sigma-70 factor (ECF subfamily)